MYVIFPSKALLGRLGSSLNKKRNLTRSPYVTTTTKQKTAKVSNKDNEGSACCDHKTLAKTSLSHKSCIFWGGRGVGFYSTEPGNTLDMKGQTAWNKFKSSSNNRQRLNPPFARAPSRLHSLGALAGWAERRGAMLRDAIRLCVLSMWLMFWV